MEIWHLFLLCFGSLFIGWYLGVNAKQKQTRSEKNLTVSGDIKHRLQLLFDSYSDESIDTFIQSLDVTSETLPLHLSIGKHFRIQGEIEKAILVHQNLMSHPELSSKASESIVYELAKDYKAAGLFDRAQALLHQLRDSKQFSVKSLRLLLDIHEAEKDWSAALAKATTVDLKKHKDIALRASQYYCEVADKLANEGLVRDSSDAYKKALSVSKECYRSHLGLANLAFNSGEYGAAIHYLKLLIGTAPEQLVIALPLLLKVTAETNSFENHQLYLTKLMADTGQIPVMLAIVDSMKKEGAEKKAASFLFEYLNEYPSLTALDSFFKLDALSEYSPEEIMLLVTKVLDVVHFGEQEFKCGACGYSGAQLHWLCPSCKNWQTIKPVIEYELSFQK